MSDTTTSLRRKIDSAGDLRSVVRTMKALAASNIGQYEKSVRALADYYRSVELGLSICFRKRALAGPQPMTECNLRTVVGPVGAVVFGSDQGLVGRFNDVVADYAVNAFNAHTAALLFELGAARVTASIELTVDEIGALVAPWQGDGFDVLVYGRPEGMTIEHCVLSAAFDREPTTCRDLCVQKHPNVSLTDPAGYTFAVATDSDCRNRLLHSRPIDASEYLPTLWSCGIRGFHLVFNVPGEPIEGITRGYRAALDAIAAGREAVLTTTRGMLDGAFTRGHFARAV